MVEEATHHLSGRGDFTDCGLDYECKMTADNNGIHTYMNRSACGNWECVTCKKCLKKINEKGIKEILEHKRKRIERSAASISKYKGYVREWEDEQVLRSEELKKLEKNFKKHYDPNLNI